MQSDAEKNRIRAENARNIIRQHELNKRLAAMRADSNNNSKKK